MSVKTKLKNAISSLPDEIASQVYDYALFLKQKFQDEQEIEQLSASPTFRRLAKKSLKEIRNNELLTLDELKKEVKRI